MTKALSLIGFCVLCLGLYGGDAEGQEVYALGGIRQNVETHKTTYTWQIEYMQRLSDYFAWSFSYLNEGHVPGHHRDGPVSQIWLRTPEDKLPAGFSIAAGTGAYRYFDTTSKTNGRDANEHGWGAVSTVAATWRVYGPWSVQLRGNWVHTEHGIDNLSALAGIGYRFDVVSAGQEGRPGKPSRKNEISLLLGQAILNHFSSETSFAGTLEYRRRVLPFLEWTFSWLHEGDNGLMNRKGLASQIWVVRSLVHERLTLGFGGGAYYIVDTGDFRKGQSLVNLFGITSSYEFMPNWKIRLLWNRVATTCENDSDVILGGIGYLF
jgi:hypothetical protein